MPDNIKEIIDTLETVDKKASTAKLAFEKLPNSTDVLNSDLDFLEDLIDDSTQNVIDQFELSKDNLLGKNFLYKMDVRLKDIITKIFDKSHNFFVVVRDDKIVYANKSFLDVIDAKDCVSIYNDKFLKFIIKEDWNILAKNIGEMLTSDISVRVRLNAINNRIIPVKLKAIYLQDNRHFTFILTGNRFYDRGEASNLLYDSVTSLPNYYLFEDRLHVAINNENNNVYEDKSMISVAVISIDSLQSFDKDEKQNIVLRKISEKILFSLDKSYTLARGKKYSFWILMPNVKNEEVLRQEIKKLAQIFESSVNDGIDEHDIIANIGVSSLYHNSNSANRLIDNAVRAAEKAKEDGGNEVVFIFD